MATVAVPQGVLWKDNGVMDYGRLRGYVDEAGNEVWLNEHLVKFIQEQRSEQARG